MPQGSSILKKLGLNMPEVPSIDPAVRKKYDESVRKKQEKDPLWKKLAGGAVDSVVGATKGFLGVDPGEDESYVGKKVNLGMQTLDAGLPLAAITKGRALYHGTDKVFEKFDPTRGNPRGILSKLINAAEHPGYADMYSKGLSSHIKGGVKGTSPNMIAIKPEAQNVLDLVNPNPDDISHALAGIDPRARRTLLDDYKMGLKHGNIDDEPPMERLASLLIDEFDNDPKALDKTLFDAVRYGTPGGPSVGLVPGRAKVKTPWGVDVSPEAKPKEGLVGIGKRFPKFISQQPENKRLRKHILYPNNQ